MIKYPIGIFISGRGSNLKSIINASKDANFPGNIVLVFSDNPNSKGMKIALESNIDTFSIDINNFKEALKKNFSKKNASLCSKWVGPFPIALLLCLFF